MNTKSFFMDTENNAKVFNKFMNNESVLDWVNDFAEYIINNQSSCSFEYNNSKDEFSVIVNFDNGITLHFNHNKYGVRVKHFTKGTYNWSVGGDDYYTQTILNLINLCFDLLNNKYNWQEWIKFVLKDGFSWYRTLDV